MIEKHVVIDKETGNPKELRYYEDGTLTARLEVVLDSDGNFVSLRELPVEDVAPQSWLDKILKRKPKVPQFQISTIDFIGLINWINTIKTINTIKNVQNIDLVKEITTIKDIQKVDLIDSITNVGTINKIKAFETDVVLPEVTHLSRIDEISLVDLITRINEITTLGTLNQINKINPSATENVVIDRVSKINQIDNITTLGTLNQLNTVGLISQLDTVGTINKIKEIAKITSGSIVAEVISNSRFETGDLTGWIPYTGSASVDQSVVWYGLPSLKLPAISVVWHYVNMGCYGYEVCLFGAVKSDTANGYVRVYLTYTDLTTESFAWQVSNANTWYYFNSRGTQSKPVLRIEVENPYTGTTTWLAGFTVLKVAQTAMQPSRTNLKVQPEREDIITKSWNLTAGTTTLLSAVSGQKHKIYGWDYEADTDGANEFSATVGGSTVRFGRRITKGVHAMSLVHPIICDVNTALSFVSAGNTKLSLRYITEA